MLKGRQEDSARILQQISLRVPMACKVWSFECASARMGLITGKIWITLVSALVKLSDDVGTDGAVQRHSWTDCTNGLWPLEDSASASSPGPQE